MTRRSPSDLRILVVDDDRLLQQALKGMLEMWGVGQAVTVGDGEEALELLRDERFDLLVTDWIMRPIGGAVLIDRLRQPPGHRNAGIPVIVLTANADVATVRAAWDAGADSVLAKPASAATIAQRIEAVLDSPRRKRLSESSGGAVAAPPVADSAPSADASPRPVTPRMTDQRADTPRRSRLLLALDRLEAAISDPETTEMRIRRAASDLQLAATGSPLATAIAGSLTGCVAWVDRDAEGFLEAVNAHAAALRWASGCDERAESLAVLLALIRSLRAMVRSLAARGSADPDLWLDGPRGLPGPDSFPSSPA